MVAEIKKLIDLAANAVKSEDALRFSQAAANVAHALAAAPAAAPLSDTTDYVLKAPAADAYIGFSREQASRRAQEVCRIAGETGQTVIAAEHLALLVPYVRHYKGYGVVKWERVVGAEKYSVRVKNVSTGSESDVALTNGNGYKFAVDNLNHKFIVWVFAIGFDGEAMRSVVDPAMTFHEGDLT